MQYAIIVTATMIDEHGNVLETKSAVGQLETKNTTSKEDRDTFHDRFDEAKLGMEFSDEDSVLRF